MNRVLPAIAVLALVGLASSLSGAASGSVTRADRVEAEARLLKVYVRHQIGGRALPDTEAEAIAERRVDTFLRQSALLEARWGVSVTPEMLDREIARIARNTRMPERLRELYTALDDDPVLIRESLARPVLVDRLVRNFFSSDERVHETAARGIREVQRRLAVAPLGAAVEGVTPYLEEVRTVPVADSVAGPPAEAALGRRRRVVSPADFARERFRFPSRPGEPSEVREKAESFEVSVVLMETEDSVEIARYVIPKVPWDEWWSRVAKGTPAENVETVATAASLPEPSSLAEEAPCSDYWDNGILDDVPEGRQGPTGVWTGSVAIFWGGGQLKSGGRYDPATDTWSKTSEVNAPSGRDYHTAVWTGTEMIVWGGFNGTQVNPALATGGRYSPLTDTWVSTSTTSAPAGRYDHAAVWSGTEMIVWGGYDDSMVLATGGRYHPATDTWTAISTAGAPTARSRHTAVWAGSRMVVWGGITGANVPFDDGGRYDPASDTWAPVSTTQAPAARSLHTAVSTGSQMIVWGGFNGSSELNTGGNYDPATNSWSKVRTVGAPSARQAHTAVWTGTEMIVWGGVADTMSSPLIFNTGGRYNPSTDRWTVTSTVNAPRARGHHAAVFGANLMIVWAGNGGVYNTGGRYSPASDSWTPTSTAGAPDGRSDFSTVWSGTHMIVWGGSTDGPSNTGGRYDPALDVWSPTTTTNAPIARRHHTAVWAGTEMIVWGGIDSDGFSLGDGKRYDPLGDAWQEMSSSGAPTPRDGHTAVWTGSRMIIWGGSTSGPVTNSGGRYDPATDSWSPTSVTGAPAPRSGHGAVWTGSLMIVWGSAFVGTEIDSTGGRYDPSTDSWTPTSLTGAPGGRQRFSTIWTGTEMMVWGGRDGSGTNYWRDGGRYDPVADTWKPTSLVGAPSFRSDHSAVWTGTRMIVWGGGFGNTLDTGGRYDPVADTWLSTSMVSAPPKRASHGAVWTGTHMIIWGGGERNDGGRYVLGPSIPSGVPTVTASKSGATATYQWSPIPEATAYDIVRGGLGALRQTGGDFAVATQTCLANDTAATSIDDSTPPPSDDGFWYLVRGVNCAGAGTYDSGNPSQVASRDPGIGSSTAACP